MIGQSVRMPLPAWLLVPEWSAATDEALSLVTSPGASPCLGFKLPSRVHRLDAARNQTVGRRSFF